MNLPERKYHIPNDCDADFAVVVTDDECEPYIYCDEVALIKRGEQLRDGDVGLFYDGTEAVIRQYCEDWAGNAYLFTLNRRRRDRDLILPAGEQRIVCCFGKVLLKEPVPLPER